MKKPEETTRRETNEQDAPRLHPVKNADGSPPRFWLKLSNAPFPQEESKE